MYTKRIIPCLDVKNGRVVKGTNFVGLRDAGDPVELAHRYDLERCDELVFLDITASNEQRDTIVQAGKGLCLSGIYSLYHWWRYPHYRGYAKNAKGRSG